MGATCEVIQNRRPHPLPCSPCRLVAPVSRPHPPASGLWLTVWWRSGMPILKTIMLKWASSGTDMERPWRPRMEARLPAAPLPRPRVPRGPLPGPSGELSDSEPPSGHSLALWRSSSSLDAGLWVIVGPRGDGGRQHHRRLAGEGAGWRSDQEPGLRGHGRAQWTNTVQGSGSKPPREAGRRLDTPPDTPTASKLSPELSLSLRGTHTPPALPCCLHVSPSLPLALLAAPRPSCAPLCR